MTTKWFLRLVVGFKERMKVLQETTLLVVLYLLPRESAFLRYNDLKARFLKRYIKLGRKTGFANASYLSTSNPSLRYDCVGFRENLVGVAFTIVTPWMIDPVFVPRFRWLRPRGEWWDPMESGELGLYYVQWGTGLVKDWTYDSARELGVRWAEGCIREQAPGLFLKDKFKQLAVTAKIIFDKARSYPYPIPVS